jgi:hypothetical protein
METKEKKDEGSGYFDLSRVWGYYFRKKDPNNLPGINTRIMHGINKIAIFMFLIGVVIMIVKAVLRT